MIASLPYFPPLTHRTSTIYNTRDPTGGVGKNVGTLMGKWGDSGGMLEKGQQQICPEKSGD
jgi:hypothetical protein